MNSTPRIFKEKLINARLSRFSANNIPDFERKFNEICQWQNSCSKGDLNRTKETSVQGFFLTRVFKDVFGYNELVGEGCMHIVE